MNKSRYSGSYISSSGRIQNEVSSRMYETRLVFTNLRHSASEQHTILLVDFAVSIRSMAVADGMHAKIVDV